jgi:hypothetical protein
MEYTFTWLEIPNNQDRGVKMDVLKTMRVGAVASFAGVPKDLQRKMPE